MRFWASMLCPLFLVACAGNPSVGDSSALDPVSSQAPRSNVEQRAKVHTDLGMQYLLDNRLDIALTEARAAIQADSSYPLAYNLLGLAQMYLKETAAAEESFNRAIRLAPGDPDINNNMGWFLCQAGRERQAIPYFETAARNPLYTSPSKALTNAAICVIGIQDDRAGEDFLLRALRADPQNVDAEYLLAELYYRTGRLEASRQRLADRHRKVEPDVQSAWLGLRLERKLGDREAEVRYGNLIRRNFPSTREYEAMMQGRFE